MSPIIATLDAPSRLAWERAAAQITDLEVRFVADRAILNTEPSAQSTLDIATSAYDEAAHLLEELQWIIADDHADSVSVRMGYSCPRSLRRRLLTIATSHPTLSGRATHLADQLNSTQPRPAALPHGRVHSTRNWRTR